MRWTADCRLGIDAIDSQHRLLFAIANELMDVDNPAEQRSEIKYLLEHLRNYVNEHFSTEESFMKESQYPYLDVHRQLHQQIITEINQAVSSICNLKELVSNLESLMNRWIREHILTEDKKIEKWIAARKAARSHEKFIS